MVSRIRASWLSISRNGTVIYAGLFGRTRIRGIEPLSAAIPPGANEGIGEDLPAAAPEHRQPLDQEP
jgi:hypothetical protein